MINEEKYVKGKELLQFYNNRPDLVKRLDQSLISKLQEVITDLEEYEKSGEPERFEQQMKKNFERMHGEDRFAGFTADAVKSKKQKAESRNESLAVPFKQKGNVEEQGEGREDIMQPPFVPPSKGGLNGKRLDGMDGIKDEKGLPRQEPTGEGESFLNKAFKKSLSVEGAFRETVMAQIKDFSSDVSKMFGGTKGRIKHLKAMQMSQPEGSKGHEQLNSMITRLETINNAKELMLGGGLDWSEGIQILQDNSSETNDEVKQFFNEIEPMIHRMKGRDLDKTTAVISDVLIGTAKGLTELFLLRGMTGFGGSKLFMLHTLFSDLPGVSSGEISMKNHVINLGRSGVLGRVFKLAGKGQIKAAQKLLENYKIGKVAVASEVVGTGTIFTGAAGLELLSQKLKGQETDIAQAVISGGMVSLLHLTRAGKRVKDIKDAGKIVDKNLEFIKKQLDSHNVRYTKKEMKVFRKLYVRSLRLGNKEAWDSLSKKEQNILKGKKKFGKPKFEEPEFQESEKTSEIIKKLPDKIKHEIKVPKKDYAKKIISRIEETETLLKKGEVDAVKVHIDSFEKNKNHIIENSGSDSDIVLQRFAVLRKEFELRKDTIQQEKEAEKPKMKADLESRKEEEIKVHKTIDDLANDIKSEIDDIENYERWLSKKKKGEISRKIYDLKISDIYSPLILQFEKKGDQLLQKLKKEDRAKKKAPKQYYKVGNNVKTLKEVTDTHYLWGDGSKSSLGTKVWFIPDIKKFRKRSESSKKAMRTRMKDKEVIPIDHLSEMPYLATVFGLTVDKSNNPFQGVLVRDKISTVPLIKETDDGHVDFDVWYEQAPDEIRHAYEMGQIDWDDVVEMAEQEYTEWLKNGKEPVIKDGGSGMMGRTLTEHKRLQEESDLQEELAKKLEKTTVIKVIELELKDKIGWLDPETGDKHHGVVVETDFENEKVTIQNDVSEELDMFTDNIHLTERISEASAKEFEEKKEEFEEEGKGEVRDQRSEIREQGEEKTKDQRLKQEDEAKLKEIIETAGQEYKGIQKGTKKIKDMAMFNVPSAENTTVTLPIDEVTPENIAKKVKEVEDRFKEPTFIEEIEKRGKQDDKKFQEIIKEQEYIENKYKEKYKTSLTFSLIHLMNKKNQEDIEKWRKEYKEAETELHKEEALIKEAKKYESAEEFINSSIIDYTKAQTGKPITLKGYHGTPDARFLEEFNPTKKGYFSDAPEVLPDNNEFIELHGDIRKGFKEISITGNKGISFSSNKKVADTYASKPAFDNQNAVPMTVERTLVLKNPKVIDMKGKKWKLTVGKDIEDAIKEGHDALIVKNVIDTYHPFLSKTPADNIIVFDEKTLRTTNQLTDIWNKANEKSERIVEPDKTIEKVENIQNELENYILSEDNTLKMEEKYNKRVIKAKELYNKLPQKNILDYYKDSNLQQSNSLNPFPNYKYRIASIKEWENVKTKGDKTGVFYTHFPVTIYGTKDKVAIIVKSSKPIYYNHWGTEPSAFDLKSHNFEDIDAVINLSDNKVIYTKNDKAIKDLNIKDSPDLVKDLPRQAPTDDGIIPELDNETARMGRRAKEGAIQDDMFEAGKEKIEKQLPADELKAVEDKYLKKIDTAGKTPEEISKLKIEAKADARKELEEKIYGYDIGLESKSGQYASTDKFADIPRGKDLTNIEMPELVSIVKEFLKQPPIIKQMRYYGVFRGGDIALNPFIFMGDENIESEQAEKTLAHEIGHMIDWLPEGELTRGNLLGRLLVLKKMQKLMIEKRGERSDLLITRKKIVAKLSRAKYLKKKGKKHNYNVPELEKKLDYLGEKIMFDKEFRKELWELSTEWRPLSGEVSDHHLKYRKSAVELYADFVSALLNNPTWAEEKAPKFFNEFFTWLDKKPHWKEHYFELINFLHGNSTAVLESRDVNIRAMFQKGKELSKVKTELREKRKKSAWFMLKNNFSDSNEAILRAERVLMKKGEMKRSQRVSTLFEERSFIDMDVKHRIEKFQEIRGKLQGNGFTDEDMDVALFLYRNITDRQQIANPLGIQRKHAEKQIGHLKKKYGEERFGLLEGAVEDVQDWWIEEVIKPAKELITPDMLADFIEKREVGYVYAPYFVQKYFLEHNVSAKISEQIGTMSDIMPASAELLMKGVAIIRAAINNNIKIKAVENLLSKDGYSKPAKIKYVKAGKKIKPIMPKEIDGYKILYYKEAGKLKAYYVDPYIYKSFHETPNEMNELTVKYLGQVNKVIKAIYVSFNIGFQLGMNPIRDFDRTHTNISFKGKSISVPKLISLYVKNMKHARNRALGIPDEKISKLEKSHMLFYNFSDMLLGLRKSGVKNLGEIDRILYKYGVVEKKHNFPKILKPAILLLEQIRHIGDTYEALSKLAAFDYLKDEIGEDKIFETERDLALFIRNFAGTPNYMKGGKLSPTTNNLFLFSNIMLQGYKTDFDAGTNPRTRSGWWWKIAGKVVIPTVITFLLTCGVIPGILKKMFKFESEDEEKNFAEWLSNSYAMIPEYDLTNYTCIPIGRENNKCVYLRVPMGETQRFLHGVLWKTLKMANGEDILRSFENVFEYGAGQLPTITPPIKILNNWIVLGTGRQPHDSFRGTDIVSDEQMDIGGSAKITPMLLWTLKQFTIPVDYKQYYKDMSGTEKIVKYSPVINRFVKISNYGIREKLDQSREVREARRKKAIEHALRNKMMRKWIKKYFDEAEIAGSELDIDLIGQNYQSILRSLSGNDNYELTKEKAKSLLTAYADEVIIRGTNPYVMALKYSTSKDIKVAKLEAIRKRVSNSQFIEILKVSILADVISKEVFKKYVDQYPEKLSGYF